MKDPPVSPDLPVKPGDTIAPHIVLSRLLGRGGMGSVWVAEHVELGTEVAVKFMSPDLLHKEGYVERFHREAKAAAQIKSPHVCQVFDHGVTDFGVPYIVMELLEGETLKERIRRLGPLPLEEVADLVTQSAKALDRAHQLGIVHRDIKPDNLFLVDVAGEPFVKILDFGVAKLLSPDERGVTSTGAMLGTPLYMSPEQLLSAKHVDVRADLWSLAATAYHAITGEVPFDGETLGALSVAVHEGVFPAPSVLRPGLPAEVDEWFARALDRDPDARFQAALELAAAFQEAAGLPPRRSLFPPAPSFEPPPVLEEAPPASVKVVPPDVALAATVAGRKRRFLLALAAGVSLVVGAGVALFFGLAPSPPRAWVERFGEAIPKLAPLPVESAVVAADAGVDAPEDAPEDAPSDANERDAPTTPADERDAGRDASADAGPDKPVSPRRSAPPPPSPPPPAPPPPSPALTTHRICIEELPDGTKRRVPCSQTSQP